MNGIGEETPEEKREIAGLQMAAFATWNERRDTIVKNALEAGFTTTYIAQAMGVARSTINRIKKRIRNAL